MEWPEFIRGVDPWDAAAGSRQDGSTRMWAALKRCRTAARELDVHAGERQRVAGTGPRRTMAITAGCPRTTSISMTRNLDE